MNILKLGWEKWKSFAVKIAEFISGVILTLFYFIIVTPHALILKQLSDPLAIKSKPHWKARKPVSQNLEDSRRQF